MNLDASCKKCNLSQFVLCYLPIREDKSFMEHQVTDHDHDTLKFAHGHSWPIMTILTMTPRRWPNALMFEKSWSSDPQSLILFST